MRCSIAEDVLEGQTGNKIVILSKRSASKDLRTEYLLSSYGSAKILRLALLAQDDRIGGSTRWSDISDYETMIASTILSIFSKESQRNNKWAVSLFARQPLR